MKSKYVLFVVLFLISLGLDQGTKIWARQNLKPQGYPLIKRETVIPIKTIVKGYFDLRYSENPGSAFGMFRSMAGARTLLFAVGILCLVVIGIWLVKLPGEAAWLGAKLGLLAGGAVGNIVDRVMFSRVTDFIVWKVTTASGVHEWPTFNIADAALVIGVLSILIDWPRDKLADATPTDSGKSADAKAEQPATA